MLSASQTLFSRWAEERTESVSCQEVLSEAQKCGDFPSSNLSCSMCAFDLEAECGEEKKKNTCVIVKLQHFCDCEFCILSCCHVMLAMNYLHSFPYG